MMDVMVTMDFTTAFLLLRDDFDDISESLLLLLFDLEEGNKAPPLHCSIIWNFAIAFFCKNDGG